MKLLLRWLIIALSLVAAVAVVPGIHVTGDGWIAVAVTAAVLGLVNAFLRPILKFLSCGCIVATLGLFTLVINALTLWLTGTWARGLFGVGFYIDGFWPALWGGVVVSVVSFALSLLLVDDRER